MDKLYDVIFNNVSSNDFESIKDSIAVSDYDYKKNLEHLRERYLNKIKWLEDRATNKNYGVIEGLLTAIHDIEDMLCGLDV